jgi:hypothetical protein
MTMRSPRRAGVACVDEAGVAERRDVLGVALLVVFPVVAFDAVDFLETLFFAAAPGVDFFVEVFSALVFLTAVFLAGTVRLLKLMAIFRLRLWREGRLARSTLGPDNWPCARAFAVTRALGQTIDVRTQSS